MAKNPIGQMIVLLVAWVGLASAAPAAETGVDANASAEATAPAPIPVVLVLDGSGSMWGRLGGEIKMEIAHSVVRELAETWGDRVALGLVAYGHRRQGDCSDVESIVLPGQSTTQAFLRAVNRVQPTGKTPLAAAIEQAAEDVGYRDRTAILAVVSDGRETCGLDPCAVASRLKADGKDLTAHVIGFDTTEEEGKELRCIASATGGQFARASSRAELVEALGRWLTDSVEATGPAILTLSAARGEHEQPIVDGLRWTITSLDATTDAAAGPLVIEGTPDPLELPAGRYAIRVEYGDTTIERQIELHGGGAWQEQVVFGPAQLALRAVLVEGTTPIDDPLDWSIHRIGPFGRVSDDPVFEEHRATCLVRLQAGHYEVRARYGDAEQRLRIELRAGMIQPHTVDLEAGEARIFASMPPPGGPFVDPVEWTIRPVDPHGSREAPIVEERSTTRTFVLPSGRYHVTGRHGGLVGDALIHVEAGRSEAVGIVLHGEALPAASGGR